MKLRSRPKNSFNGPVTTSRISILLDSQKKVVKEEEGADGTPLSVRQKFATDAISAFACKSAQRNNERLTNVNASITRPASLIIREEEFGETVSRISI